MAWGRRPGLVLWLSVVAGGVLLEGWLLVGPLSHDTWTSPVGLFVIVTVAASLCALAAVPVLVRAYRRGRAELGLLGAAMYCVSVLPLVHGLTAPGVWYGPNSAVTLSVLFAGPAAAMTCVPLVVPRSLLGRTLARHWQVWTTSCMAAVTVLAVGLLIAPNLVAAPAPRSAVPLVVMVVCFSALTVVSWRELRLYWISQRGAFLGASIAVAFLALTSTVWLGREPFSIGWWVVHALDITGVFGVLGALWLAPDLRQTVSSVLDPVLTRDPLVAFEVGLAPVVHDFVAALERKDQITRDHVGRVAELAGRTGEALRLSPIRLRRLILGALLHDIGKIGIDDTILTSPGALTPEQYAEVQTHTVIGDEILRAVPSLQEVAPIVRAHHERLDGTGYPDQLHALDIPLEARVIAVCDAYDAMANTRHYRRGMGRDRSIAILEEHAGTQWDPRIVQTVSRITQCELKEVFNSVGRPHPAPAHACECLDALPESVQALFT